MFSSYSSPNHLATNNCEQSESLASLATIMQSICSPHVRVTLSPSRSSVDIGMSPSEVRHSQKRAQRTESSLGSSGSSGSSSPARRDMKLDSATPSPKRQRGIRDTAARASELSDDRLPYELSMLATRSSGESHTAVSRHTPSSKDSTRIFALMWLCSSYLPTVKPDWVPRSSWDLLLHHRDAGTLVQIVTFSRGILTLRFPEIYDVIVHSRAIYGPSLRKWTKSIKTRFRWWSDNSVKQFHPIKNCRISDTHLERIITVTLEITNNPYLQSLFLEGYQSKLLNEVSDFFANLLHGWLKREDIEVLDLLGFGRTRRKLQARYNDADRGFDDVLRFSIAEWNQKMPSTIPLPSVSDIPIC